MAWWQALLGCTTLAAVAYVVVAQGLAAGIVALIGVAAAVFTVWNPFQAKPRPELSLELPNGATASSCTLGGLRPVDIDAIVNDAEQTALGMKLLEPFLALQGYAKPTQEDHAAYAADVSSYAERFRGWVEKTEAWRQDRSRILRARVIQRNPTSVDAENAGVYVIFPVGSEEEESEESIPKQPEIPDFPLRRSVISTFGPSSLGPGAHLPPISAGRARAVQRVKPVSIWDATYERLGDQRLEVTYRRQTIHHGEREPAGKPFSVRIPEGDHQIRWRIHAANMPAPAAGTWELRVGGDSEGQPITTKAEFEEALGLRADDSD
jgi:hypothetical protein